MSHEPLKGSRLLFGTLTLSLVNFMVILDMTIANVAVPSIAGSLAASPHQGTWVITSYAVAEAITVPLTGWLAQRFGTVRLAVICILLFTAASIACGLATSLPMLVAMRVLQGLAGGPIMAVSQALMIGSYPPEKSGSAMGLYAMTTLLAPVLGPILGGLILESFSWHWIFLINVPVGLLGAFLVWEVYRDRESETQRLPVDRVGLVLLVLFVGCLQIVLDKGQEEDWFSSTFIVTLVIVSSLSFVVFLIWELTEKNPIVDLRLFELRNVAAGVVGISIFFGIVFGGIVLLPLWLQTQMGYTAIQAGLAIAPMGLAAAFVAPFVGKAVGKVDLRIIASCGVLLISTSFWMRSHFTTDIDFFHVALPQIVQGAGMPMIFMPFTILATASVDRRKVASVSGLQNFMRTTAGAFGAALTSTLWANNITQHRSELIANVSHGSLQTETWQATLMAQGMSPEQATAMLDRAVQSQAVMLATDEYFLSASLLTLVVLGVVWITKPSRLPGAMAGQGAGGH